MTKAKRVGEVCVMHKASRLSCILLCVVRVNRQRGQWQGDRREEEKQTTNKPTERGEGEKEQ